MSYEASNTAILLIDPYNDFLSEGGKLYERSKEVAQEVNLLQNLAGVLNAGRAKGFKVFFVPHHRYEEGDYVHWEHPTPYQLASAARKTFAKGTWGGTFHDDFQPKEGDITVHEHWGSSGFANTDLDFQLKQFKIRRVILIGLLANTCIEVTGRFAMELGYHVTLVKDATAAYSHEAMHAAHHTNGPTYAHAIFTTEELLKELEA